MAQIPSGIEIIVDGTDITLSVLYAPTRFSTQWNAQPGACEIHVRDKEQVHSFTTGDEVVLKLDGVELWG